MGFDNMDNRGVNACFTTGLLVMDAGAVLTYTTTAAIQNSLDGKISSKATIASAAEPTLDAVTGLAFPLLVGGASVLNTPGSGAVIVWCLDSTGTVKVVHGPVTRLDMQGNFPISPAFPGIPDTLVPFAYSVLKAGATAAVNVQFGVTVHNAAGYTNVTQNVHALPSRPQIA